MISLAVVVAAAGIARADPPPLIRYQARLTDASGTPLTGVHEISFRLYDQETGGTPLWSEGPTAIDLGSGSVDFLLGTVTPLTSSLFVSPDRWLEVAVDGVVLSPRQRLSSVPFAMVADRLGTQTLAQVEAGVDADIAAHEALPNPHPVYVRKTGDSLTGDLSFFPAGSSTTLFTSGDLFLQAGGQAEGAIEIFTGQNMVFRGGNGKFFFIQNNGTPRFLVDAALGRVGIGTTVPSEALDVVGNARVAGLQLIEAGSTVNAGLEIRGTSGSFGPSVSLNNGTQAWKIVSWSDDSLKFVKSTGTTFTPLTINNTSFHDALVLAPLGVGVATASPRTKLEVAGGSVYISSLTGALWFKTKEFGISSNHHMFMAAEQADDKSEGLAIYHLNITTPTDNITNTGKAFRFEWDGDAFGRSWNSAGLDLAEKYPDFEPGLEAGDVVSLDPFAGMRLVAASTPYEDSLLGVVSDEPGLLLGGSGPDTYDPSGLDLALSGRVPVKVTMENGPIRPGDYLSSSTRPGWAARATRSGRVIGMALEPREQEGKILLFVNPHYRVSPEEHAALERKLETQDARLRQQAARLRDLEKALGEAMQALRSLQAGRPSITGGGI